MPILKALLPDKKGIAHHILPIVIVVGVAIIGIWRLVESHALPASHYVYNCTNSAPAMTPAATTASPFYLQSVTRFGTNYAPKGAKYPSGFQNYGYSELGPRGFIATNHYLPQPTDLVLRGYPDPKNAGLLNSGLPQKQGYNTVPGVVGAGFDLSNSNQNIDGSGGFDVCFSMSPGIWQTVHLVIEAWPSNGHWNEGEIDIFEGTPTKASLFVHQINTSTPKYNVFWGSYPSIEHSPGSHLVSGRWDQHDGYSFYFDGKLIAHTPVEPATSSDGAIEVPTTMHHLSIQMQDTSLKTKQKMSATIYWAASYGYN